MAACNFGGASHNRHAGQPNKQASYHEHHRCRLHLLSKRKQDSVGGNGGQQDRGLCAHGSADALRAQTVKDGAGCQAWRSSFASRQGQCRH